MVERQVLLNPGPVTLSDRVRAALGRGDWCHREPEFAALTRDLNERLVRVHPSLQEDFEAVTITGSGTAAVEGMLHAFAPREGGTLVASNGVYGERIAAMLAAQGKPLWSTAGEWREPIDLTVVNSLLDAHPAISCVVAVHHETTTGRLNDMAALGATCRERGLTLLLDCVSSFGAEAIEAEAWNLGALAATANKCLHGVPGLSFVLARAEAWRVPRESGPASVYLDLHRTHRAQHADGYSPYTQAVQVAFALQEALRELEEEGGWAARHESYARRGAALARTLGAAGVEPLLPAADSSVVLRSWWLPAHWTYARLHDALKAQGIVIYAGQGRLHDDVFRLAHMGAIDEDLERVGRALAACFGGS